jgi:hypothetical protein
VKSLYLQEDQRTIKSALDNCLPPVIAPEEPRTVHDASKENFLTFQTLISLRRSHQRRQAQTGTRKQANQITENMSEIQPGSNEAQASSSSTLAPSAPELKLSRRDLLREFQAVIKAQEERGVATAVGCKVCWESQQPGRQSAADHAETSTVTGNSANAQQVAANEAKKVSLYEY